MNYHRFYRTNFLTVCALLIGASVPSLAFAASGATPFNDCEVLARVNNQVILACELNWEAELVLKRRLGELPPEQLAAIPPAVLADAKDKLLEQLLMNRLDMALFYADFRSNAPQADLAKIHESLDKTFYAQELPQLMKRLGVKKVKELDAKLKPLGTSVAERRDDFNRKMIARSWLTETVKFKKEVTHDQMLAYYREHKSQYAKPTRSRWEELMVSFDKYPTKKAAYAAVAALGNQSYQAVGSSPAKQPCFTQIAKLSSNGFTALEGGIHEWTTQGSLAAESVDEAIFSLPAGQMSSILEGPTGFHIVRVLEREQAGYTPFRDVQNGIASKIRDQRFDIAVKFRVMELKQKAHVWTKFKGNLPRPEQQVASKQGSDTYK